MVSSNLVTEAESERANWKNVNPLLGQTVPTAADLVCQMFLAVPGFTQKLLVCTYIVHTLNQGINQVLHK